MDEHDTWMLTEREKELECMYASDEILQNKQLAIPAAMDALARVLPTGFTDTPFCRAKIVLNSKEYMEDDYPQAIAVDRTPIEIDTHSVGYIEIGFMVPLPGGKEPSLLDSERKLLSTMAGRISYLMLNSQRELAIVFDMLQRIDPDMLDRLCEKLLIHLKNHPGEWTDGFFGDAEAPPRTYGEVNAPLATRTLPDMLAYGKRLIADAASFMPIAEVYELINGWIQEERLFSLVKAVGNRDTEIAEILDALRNYSHTAGRHANSPTETWLIAELAHRFLTNDEWLIHNVQDNLTIHDFEPMLEKTIGSPGSDGNIGGKGAGLFVAKQILNHAMKTDPLLADIKTPRTWYLAADQLSEFLRYNHMEDMNAYKYNPISHLRLTYDNVVSKIKNARLPPHILQMLGLLLDDLCDAPIIVRSSSLLEDRANAAFSGKYKSLFLPNVGSKQERLEQLRDAILEVYSSQYNPDSLQYRQERRLLNFTERMGILIQEVVGKRIGPYYMPLFAGVAFSENPLLWSPRITREGGLARMVMGLGTRAVDRVNDDYPMLFSPGQPGMRINQSPKDIKHYSPKYIDLINLEEKRFETVPAEPFLKEWGGKIPGLHKLVSVYYPEYMQEKNAFELSPKDDDLVITFEGILSSSDIPAKLERMLKVLSGKMKTPVDIEFAFDGESIVLLQCRALSRGTQHEAAPIPKNLPQEDVLFTANRYISNGRIENIRHIVYVDAEEYHSLARREDLLSVGKAVGLLNDMLPRHKYILMGPGRWGSRGDVQLGVRVTYADICNTAALIEIAWEKHAYSPELSFGTHFFQDLVEANIAYIPLYPGDSGTLFKERYFQSSHNLLEELLPQYAHLSSVIRVIDVPMSSYGRRLFLYMNAQLKQAVAFLAEEADETALEKPAQGEPDEKPWREPQDAEHWRWRKYMAEQIAAEMDMQAMGVKGIYLFGSTDSESAGMGSDIDLIVYFVGTPGQRALLEQWLDGWSKALAKINFLRTGYMAQGLLDPHLVTDEDIRNKDSYAIRMHSVTDPATPLRVL